MGEIVNRDQLAFKPPRDYMGATGLVQAQLDDAVCLGNALAGQLAPLTEVALAQTGRFVPENIHLTVDELELAGATGSHIAFVGHRLARPQAGPQNCVVRRALEGC